MMKVLLREYITRQPNGDRDTEVHPSSEWKIVLEKTDKNKVRSYQELNSFNQFDPFWSSIGNRSASLREAKKYADEVANFLGVKVVEETYRQKVVRSTSWEKV